MHVAEQRTQWEGRKKKEEGRRNGSADPPHSPMTEQWESRGADIPLSIRLSNKITVFPHTSSQNTLKLHLSASELQSKHNTATNTWQNEKQAASTHPFQPPLCFPTLLFKPNTFILSSWNHSQVLAQDRKSRANMKSDNSPNPFLSFYFLLSHSLPFWITAPACEAKLLLLLLLPGHAHSVTWPPSQGTRQPHPSFRESQWRTLGEQEFSQSTWERENPLEKEKMCLCHNWKCKLTSTCVCVHDCVGIILSFPPPVCVHLLLPSHCFV